MNIQIMSSELGTVITIEGRVVLGQDVENLRKELLKIIENGGKKIVLDLKNVTFIDSSGLSTLALLHKTIDSMGGKLALTCFSPQISRMVEITGLSEIFTIYDSTNEALMSGFLLSE